MEEDSTAVPPTPKSTENVTIDPKHLDSLSSAPAKGAGLQQPREQETENQELQHLNADMENDSPVTSPTPVAMEDETENREDLRSRGAAAGGDAALQQPRWKEAGTHRNQPVNDDMEECSPVTSAIRESMEDEIKDSEHLDSRGAPAGEETGFHQSTEAMDWFGRVVLYVRNSLGLGSSCEVGNDSSTTKQVLVFGSSGTGKTSLVNALTGRNMPTGDGARGITFESSEVSASHDGVDYRLIDTVGLNEADNGGVSGENAVTALVRLLERTEGGLNLMVMVVKKGRIHDSTLDNHKLFVETMTSRAVPLLIVVTHCERERGNMQGWVDANRQDFLSRGIKAEKIVATTFVTPDPRIDNVEAMDRKVGQSVDLSWGAIRAFSTPKRVDFMNSYGGFFGVTRKMYHSVARHVGAGSEWARDAYVNFIQRVEIVDHADAVKAAKQT